MNIDEEIASLAASHRALVADLTTREPLDPAAESLLPDWSLGHVLTHIARNADSQLSLLSGLPQYPHGREGRNADIEAGAGRSWPDLVDDVATSASRVDAAFAAEADWAGSVDTIGAPRPKDMLPQLRQREVEIHRIDLGLGHTFDDLPADYLRRELRTFDMLWRARHPMGLTGLPSRARETPPPLRLAWLLGRSDIDGLEPAGLF